MSWRKATPSEVKALRAASSAPSENPIERWTLQSSGPGGNYELNGYVAIAARTPEGEAEVKRYTNAVAKGLRDAGYTVVLTLERAVREVVE